DPAAVRAARRRADDARRILHEELQGGADVSDAGAARADAAAGVRDDAERQGELCADVDSEPRPAPADHFADPSGSDPAGIFRAGRGQHAAGRARARLDRGEAVRALEPARLAGDLRLIRSKWRPVTAFDRPSRQALLP